MNQIRKAVIPIAGMGTRFLPVTKSVPKEMLPIIDKPTLQYIIEEAVDSGIEEILLITSPYKRNVEDHFDRSYELESRLQASGKEKELKMIRDISSMAKIYYIRQGEPKGSAHAVGLAKAFVGDEPFAILYGDDLMLYDKNNPVLKQLIDLHDKTNGNIIGVQEVDKNLVDKYGIIDYADKNTGKIKGIVEKPSIENAPSNIAGLGRYIVNNTIFDIIDNLQPSANGEYQLTDAFKILMTKEDFYACRFKGKYYDIGSKIGYMKANIDFALQRDDLKEDLMNYLKEII